MSGDPSAAVFRYEGADPMARATLATGFDALGSISYPIALSPDEQTIFFLELGGKVYAIDIDDGATTEIADLSDMTTIDPLTPKGITVYPPATIPTLSGWGLCLLTALLLFCGAWMLRKRTVVS